MGVKATAYERIKEWILKRPLPPGSRMVEQAVAEQLGLSRIPVREAFQRLHHEGFLVKTGDKGLELRTYTAQSLVDLFTYREYLDGLTARLFALRAEDAEVKHLGMILEDFRRLRASYDQKRQWAKDHEFHVAVTRGARNERILEPHRSILQECLYLGNILFVGTREVDPLEQLEVVIREHERIVEALEARDGERAEDAARASVRAGLERSLHSLLRRGTQAAEVPRRRPRSGRR